MRPKQPQGALAGLFNQGNTCYMNCIMQCLAHTVPFGNLCQQNFHSHRCVTRGQNCVLCTVENNVNRLLRPSGPRDGSFTPEALYRQVARDTSQTGSDSNMEVVTASTMPVACASEAVRWMLPVSYALCVTATAETHTPHSEAFRTRSAACLLTHKCSSHHLLEAQTTLHCWYADVQCPASGMTALSCWKGHAVVQSVCLHPT